VQTPYSCHLNFRHKIRQTIDDMSHQALCLNHLIPEQTNNDFHKRRKNAVNTHINGNKQQSKKIVKMIKMIYHPPTYWPNVNVMLSDFCHFYVLLQYVAINVCINCSFTFILALYKLTKSTANHLQIFNIFTYTAKIAKSSQISKINLETTEISKKNSWNCITYINHVI